MDPLINVSHQDEELKQYVGGSSCLQGYGQDFLMGWKFNKTMASYVFSCALFNSELHSYLGT